MKFKIRKNINEDTIKPGIDLDDYELDEEDPDFEANLSRLGLLDDDEDLTEDTIKQGNKWVNKGKEGTHGKFKTKKEADAQRKAMFANGFKESLEDKDDNKFSIIHTDDDWYIVNGPRGDGTYFDASTLEKCVDWCERNNIDYIIESLTEAYTSNVFIVQLPKEMQDEIRKDLEAIKDEAGLSDEDIEAAMNSRLEHLRGTDDYPGIDVDKYLNKLNEEVDLNEEVNATDVVTKLYDIYPELSFYDERELSDGSIELRFDDLQRVKNNDSYSALVDLLNEWGVKFVDRGNRLYVIAPEAEEYKIESLKEDYSTLWDSARVKDIVDYYLSDSRSYDADTVAKLVYKQMKSEGSTLPPTKDEFIKTVYHYFDEFEDFDESLTEGDAPATFEDDRLEYEIFFTKDGEEDYTFIKAYDEDDAVDKASRFLGIDPSLISSVREFNPWLDQGNYFHAESLDESANYKLRIYKKSGPDKGNFDREETFSTKEDAVKRYKELFNHNDYALNPTMWVQDGKTDSQGGKGWRRLSEVEIHESLNEASYGGAWDIEDDAYFSREQLNEFGYQIEDVLLNEIRDKDPQLNGIWLDRNIITVAFMDKDGNEVEVTQRIDFRKVKTESDLSRYYLTNIVDNIEKEFMDIHRDYNESLTENASSIRDVVNNSVSKLSKDSSLDEIKRVITTEMKNLPGEDNDKLYNQIFDDVILKLNGHNGSFIEPINKNESLTEEMDEGDTEFYKADDGCFYKFLDRKTVYDSDGFTTDYTLYMKATPEGDRLQVSFVCVFGDSDLYRPEDGYYDFETNNADEAFEWFEDYGNEEESDNWYESLDTIPGRLNKLDSKALDEGTKYYDLKNLFEAVSDKLTAQDKQELKNIINSTNDPKTISSYLDAKLNPKDEKNNMNEDIDDEPYFEVDEEVELDEKNLVSFGPNRKRLEDEIDDEDPEDEFGHY